MRIYTVTWRVNSGRENQVNTLSYRVYYVPCIKNHAVNLFLIKTISRLDLDKLSQKSHKILCLHGKLFKVKNYKILFYQGFHSLNDVYTYDKSCRAQNLHQILCSTVVPLLYNFMFLAMNNGILLSVLNTNKYCH